MSLVNLNSENFTKEVLEEEKPVLIDFWADWCSPCKMMAPVVDNIAESMSDTIKVCKVNIDENEELAEEYGIMSIPTFIVIKNGKETGRTVGVQSKEELLRILQ